MGTHIYGRLEKRDSKGEWETVNTEEDWFDFQSYFVYGWMANIRNSAKLPPLPFEVTQTSDHGDESDYTYTLEVRHLLDFNYKETVYDARHDITATWEGHLGGYWFEKLQILRDNGVERLVFSFN